MTSNPLWQCSAADVVRALKAGEVSPREALDAAYARIDAVEPSIHAMPTLCPDRAYEQAMQIEADIATKAARRTDPTWLAGLPIAIKDLSDVSGVRTTYGSPIFADHVPTESDFLVQRLEANGAVIIGKTNTPEFGAGGHSFNAVFPTTTTPWKTDRSAGGSSGGSAAALASGEAWLATGSDYGGSLRTPASFCGVVGLRPSPGRVADGPNSVPFESVAVSGPMARTVADTALFLDAMVGRDDRDPRSWPAPDVAFFDALNTPPKTVRAAFSADLGITPIDPEVAAICQAAVSKLSDAGWLISENIPNFTGAMEAFHALRAASFAAGRGAEWADHREALKPEIIWNVERGLNQSGETLATAEQARGALVSRLQTFFETQTLLLAPTACMPPFPADWRYPEALGDAPFTDYMDWLRLPCVLSITGCPVLSLPVGITEDGLPVGLQLCGANGSEHAVLAAAAQAEAILGMLGTTPINPVSPAP